MKQDQQHQEFKDEFDDDFDYEDNEDPKQQSIQPQIQSKKSQPPPQKETLDIKKQLKKYQISKEEVRKKNYIGDSVIAERNEQDESENQENLLNNPDSKLISQEEHKPQYMKKFSKISQLYDESTKDYKLQQKEMGIKLAEQDIVRKAKQDMKKIEEYKNKFRNSAFGGVITNQLSSSLEKIKAKHGASLSGTQPRQKPQSNTNLSLKHIKKELTHSSEFIEGPSAINIEVDLISDLNQEGKMSKKKKKKKKKKSVQQQSDEDFNEDTNHRLQKLDDEEADLNMDDDEIIMPLSKQKQVQQIEVEEEKVIDWEMLNKKNVKGKVQFALQNIDEEEKNDIERRKIIYSYKQIMQYFTQSVDLSKEIEQIQQYKENFRNQGFFQRLASCFSSPKLNTDELCSQRDILFALTRVKLDTQKAEHEVLIKSIYKKLTHQDQCRTIGSHWGDIGFQGSDPKTDVRGAGILGLIHMLFFIDNYPETSQAILKYSNKEKVEFPLAVKMFEYTLIVINLLREGKLYSLCNEQRNVYETATYVYSSIFMLFIFTYVEGQLNITHMNDLNVKLEKQAKGNVRAIIKDLFMIDDKQALQLFKDSIRAQSERQKEKIKQLAEESNKNTFQVGERANQAQQRYQKARNYESQDLIDDRSQQIQNRAAKQTNSGFSAI